MLILLFASAAEHLFQDAGDDEHIRREVEERAKAYRASRERLRADIVLAIDGPQEAEVLEIIEGTLGDERAALATPDYEPNLRGLIAEMSALRRIAEIAIAEEKRRIDEDEADVELLLLQ